MQTLTDILDNLNRNTLALTSGYDFADNPEIKQIIEQEAEVFNEYLSTLKENNIDLHDEKNLKAVEKEAQRAEKSISLILDNQQKELEISQMSKMLLDISRKLDRVMVEQATQKANLSKIELGIKNSEAELIKKIEEPYKIPMVPKNDMREIYDFYQFRLNEILQNTYKYGAEYYRDIYGEKFYNELPAEWVEGDKDKSKGKTEKMLKSVYRVASYLILFVEDVDAWSWSSSKNAKLRDVDYVELMELDSINTILKNTGLGMLAEDFKRLYEDILCPENRIPIKIREAIKNYTYMPNVVMNKAFVARKKYINFPPLEAIIKDINNYQDKQ